LVASELDPTAGRSGMPTWIWAALGIVAIATIYFVFMRTGLSGGDVTSALPTPAKPATIAPVEANAPAGAAKPPDATTSSSDHTSPSANPPLQTASAAPEPPRSVPEGPRPVQNAPAVATAKKATEHTAKTPVAAVQTPKASVASPAVAVAGKPEPTRADRKIDGTKPTSPEATAPASLDGAVEGVEAVADLSAPAPTTTIARGTLISIDAADTIPVALSHRVRCSRCRRGRCGFPAPW
jgi:hypothetical protein